MAFSYFKQEKADIVSLEVGLGGRLDATNVVDPLVSIIVSIGLDHMSSLGETVYDIASNFVLLIIKKKEEKAGIIKPHRPVIVGPDCPHEIFKERAE